MTIPFSLRIFVADGDPDGLRIVDKSNWIGKALVFPRALLPQVKARPELAQTGVYLLLGPRPDGEGDMLYVGEGDPIRPRLESHYAQKDFWTRAIGFTTTTAGQLNKAHVQFLESRLIALARAAKRMPLDNANQPAEPSLSEADRADMEVFLGHMLGMLPVLGVHAFEQAPKAPAAKAGPLLTCKGKGVQATGYEASQGFVVRAGSQAVATVTPSFARWQARVNCALTCSRAAFWTAEGDVLKFTPGLCVLGPFCSVRHCAGWLHQRAAELERRQRAHAERAARSASGLAELLLRF